MRELSTVESNTAAAVLNFFAVHHLDPDGVLEAMIEWQRVLRPGGHLVLAAWEGTEAIDYGKASDVVALRYTETELASWSEQAGFSVTRRAVETVEGFPMCAVYVECVKKSPRPCAGEDAGVARSPAGRSPSFQNCCSTTSLSFRETSALRNPLGKKA